MPPAMAGTHLNLDMAALKRIPSGVQGIIADKPAPTSASADNPSESLTRTVFRLRRIHQQLKPASSKGDSSCLTIYSPPPISL
jgi:hypothetical protein